MSSLIESMLGILEEHYFRSSQSQIQGFRKTILFQFFTKSMHVGDRKTFISVLHKVNVGDLGRTVISVLHIVF